eukprot:CAMPEP_0178695346 /NCGR_PEP_ID=MMETSP0699-20121125/8802_1 /TAXON_ID=265572 /ORGANISM="Extubocellulus spinifer, Strain CCMP396" /LENGTH=94 /DNA_ID=CAMNT_0020341029 /DNA_START=233 /DNA_END=514 /DNA_ORIENTATION=-
MRQVEARNNCFTRIFRGIWGEVAETHSKEQDLHQCLEETTIEMKEFLDRYTKKKAENRKRLVKLLESVKADIKERDAKIAATAAAAAAPKELGE